MRVACVLITHLRAKAEMRRQPHLKGRAALIVDRNPSIGIPVVVDRFPEASGVMVGMTPEQAVSRHANAVVLDADEPLLSSSLRAGAHFAAGDQRQGRGRRDRHGVRAGGRPGRAVPGRGGSHVHAAERGAGVPETLVSV